MRRSILRLAPVALTAILFTLASAEPAAAPARFTTVTLHIFNRVFPSFHDKIRLSLKEEVRVGDTEYTARLLQYLPDFDMDIKAHRIFSKSPEPKNPAFQIVVRKNGVPQDTTWAFLDMPPHYTRRSLLAFIATKVEFANRPAIVSQDSLALKIMQKDGETH